MTASDLDPESRAIELDALDPLRGYRERFLIPEGPDGKPAAYLAGNSLGLQARSVEDRVRDVLDGWARWAVAGHFVGERPWYTYPDRFREPLARLVGAHDNEVVVMNGLSVNLHLLMVTFYRPTAKRHKVLIERPCFPSDRYVVETQIRHHGLDPRRSLVEVGGEDGCGHVLAGDVEAVLEREAGSVALMLMGGVNFLTGQRLDVEGITRVAKGAGARVGWDLAHAVGNVELRLHDWDVDFAAWCSYKYLNGGPGSLAGCFIHERHASRTDLPRFGGWWGNDPATRFQMQMLPEFLPVPSAHGWQLSNPPVLAMAPLQASLEIFGEVGMGPLKEKSRRLTAYLEGLLDRVAGDRLRIITPRDPERRGCQLSLAIQVDARGCQRTLDEAGVVCDFREPDVVRVAPVPLYNTYHDVWRFAQALGKALSASTPQDGAS